jgi:DNA-binding response OmpR family regulator
MRLLVIEDEPKLADYLHKGLSENGYVVDVARDGIQGRLLACDGEYDLVLLDLMLPGVDGFGVLKAMRERGQRPVLMLTARDKVEDRVRGLQEGADDYLVKPFAFSELLARVAALLRRGAANGHGGGAGSGTQLRLADLELDLASRKAHRGGVARHVSAAQSESGPTLRTRSPASVMSDEGPTKAATGDVTVAKSRHLRPPQDRHRSTSRAFENTMRGLRRLSAPPN